MRQWSPESDSFIKPFRYALLVLVYCAVNAIELVHAKFALLTPSELRAYWSGRVGQFPCDVLPWSERHFGGDALAMRLPMLAVFAVMLMVVLLVLDRMVFRKMSPVVVVAVVAVALCALGVQQVFALKKLRAERRALFALRDSLERAAAPSELILVEDERLLPTLEWYGSVNLRQQIRPEILQPPRNEEYILIGGSDSYTPCTMHEDTDVGPEVFKILSNRYAHKETRIYFVSPPAKDVPSAVSSKP